jgi:hypothetical protein
MEEMVSQANDAASRAYRREAFRCYSIFMTKNKQYGNSIQETGVLGAVVELVAKNARLRKLVLQNTEWGHWNGAEYERQEQDDIAAVRDTLRDLVNYGVISLMMLEQGNWKGVEHDA